MLIIKGDMPEDCSHCMLHNICDCFTGKDHGFYRSKIECCLIVGETSDEIHIDKPRGFQGHSISDEYGGWE